MLLDDLSTYLQPLLTIPVQKGQWLELPDAILAIRETGGFPSQYVAGPTALASQAILDEPTVQIVTRAKDYLSAMAACRQAHQLLDGLREMTINSVLYHTMRAMQPPFFLMRDDNKRYLCAFNVHIQRRNVT